MDFNKYCEYQTIPKDFDGTIIIHFKTDNEGYPLFDVDTYQQVFNLFKDAFPNNNIIATIGVEDIEGEKNVQNN